MDRSTLLLSIGFLIFAGCTVGAEGPLLSRRDGGPGGGAPGCPGHVVDGAFSSLGDPDCGEWDVAPMRGRFGDLYVDVDSSSRLHVLNDWHLRDDAPAEAEMFNLFCLATDLGVFEIRVFGDQHVEAWLDGERVDERVEGASGFGPSPLTPMPHSIFEFQLAELPTTMRVLECDPAGGTIQDPAPPPGVRLASGSSCFPGSTAEVPHNLVVEPTIFDFELGPAGVLSAAATSWPAILGTDLREVEAGGTLTIYGANLVGGSAVFIGDSPATVTARTESSVSVTVPDVVGEVEIRIQAGGTESNVLHVTALAPDCEPVCGACGSDGCGGSCGECAGGYFCDEGTQACVPDDFG